MTIEEYRTLLDTAIHALVSARSQCDDSDVIETGDGDDSLYVGVGDDPLNRIRVTVTHTTVTVTLPRD